MTENDKIVKKMNANVVWFLSKQPRVQYKLQHAGFVLMKDHNIPNIALEIPRE